MGLSASLTLKIRKAPSLRIDDTNFGRLLT